MVAGRLGHRSMAGAHLRVQVCVVFRDLLDRGRGGFKDVLFCDISRGGSALRSVGAHLRVQVCVVFQDSLDRGRGGLKDVLFCDTSGVEALFAV
jgi:hypothetical protein